MLLSRFLAPILIYSSLLVPHAWSQPFFHEGVPTIGEAQTNGEHPQSFAPLVRQLSPGVVNISVETEAQIDENSPEGGIPGLPQMPGLPFYKHDQGIPMRSLGSGFILNEEGYIVTNNHVIDKANKIVVRLLNDKTAYLASVRGIDDKTDIALLQITPKYKLTPLYLGNSDEAEVGDWVLAIGNQFQLGQTVTAGIVSAKSRRLPVNSAGPYDNFIQTDASINPGSSGGPLINARGQVIGINTAIFSPNRTPLGGTGFNIGIGFSIPINLVKGIITQLKENKHVTRGLLGVMIQRIDDDMAEALKLPNPDGALVSDIVKDSPASFAGFQRRDVIVSYNGKPVHDHDELPLMVASTPVGTSVPIEVIRNGKHEILHAKIGELKDTLSSKGKGSKKTQNKPDEIGLVLDEVTSQVAQALKLPTTNGALVQSVDPGSPAELAGFSRGDVIVEIGGQTISDPAMFERMLKGLPSNKPILTLIAKPEGTRYLTFKKK